jgi:hypothetical protein
VEEVRRSRLRLDYEVRGAKMSGVLYLSSDSDKNYLIPLLISKIVMYQCHKRHTWMPDWTSPPQGVTGTLQPECTGLLMEEITTKIKSRRQLAC